MCQRGGVSSRWAEGEVGERDGGRGHGRGCIHGGRGRSRGCIHRRTRLWTRPSPRQTRSWLRLRPRRTSSRPRLHPPTDLVAAEAASIDGQAVAEAASSATEVQHFFFYSSHHAHFLLFFVKNGLPEKTFLSFPARTYSKYCAFGVNKIYFLNIFCHMCLDWHVSEEGC